MFKLPGLVIGSWLMVYRTSLKQINLKFHVFTMNYELITTNQHGFTPILVLLLLLAGIAGGTYLAQQRTNILPFAAEITQCDDGTPINTWKDLGCSTTQNHYKNAQFCDSSGNLSNMQVLQDLNCVVVETPAAPVEQSIPPCGDNRTFVNNVDGSRTTCTTGTECDPNVRRCVPISKVNVVECEGQKEDVNECKNGRKCVNIFNKVQVGDGINCRWDPATPYFRCFDDSSCGEKSANAPAPITPPKPQAQPASPTLSAGSGGEATTVAPTDAASCSQEKACIFSEGNNCKVGLCSSNDCEFNKNCSFQTAVQKECISGTKYKIGDKDYKPGDSIDCSQANSAGTTGSTNSSSSGSTTAAANIPQTDTDLAKKCGFTENSDGNTIPFFKFGIGENASISDEACKELLAAQLKEFNEVNARAAQKLRDLAENSDGVVKISKSDDGKYTAGFSDPSKANDPENIKKVEEAQKAANQLNEANNKVAACNGKEGQAMVDCLKDAQGSVQASATEAQKAMLAGYLTKFNDLLSKFGQKVDDDKCVKADLGVAPFMDAKRLKASSGRSENDTTRQRLLICLGSIGDLKWRVLVGGESGAEFADDDGEDKGNDAERLWGLYGTESNASGPRWSEYPNGFTINPCVSLHPGEGGKVTPDSVKSDLAKYIAAAEGRTPNIPECKKASNPNDTGGNGSERRSGTTGTEGGTTETSTEEGTNSTNGTTDTTKTDTPGVDGGKTNKCTNDAVCQKKNDPNHTKGTYKCDLSNGQCYLAS